MQAEIPKKKTISVEELAAQLGLSRNRTYEALNEGEIPAVRIGKRFLIAADTADRLLAGAAKGGNDNA